MSQRSSISSHNEALSILLSSAERKPIPEVGTDIIPFPNDIHSNIRAFQERRRSSIANKGLLNIIEKFGDVSQPRFSNDPEEIVNEERKSASDEQINANTVVAANELVNTMLTLTDAAQSLQQQPEKSPIRSDAKLSVRLDPLQKPASPVSFKLSEPPIQRNIQGEPDEISSLREVNQPAQNPHARKFSVVVTDDNSKVSVSPLAYDPLAGIPVAPKVVKRSAVNGTSDPIGSEKKGFKDFASVVSALKGVQTLDALPKSQDGSSDVAGPSPIQTFSTFQRWKTQVKKKKLSIRDKIMQEAAIRATIELPHSLRLDLISEAIPIVTKMVNSYKKQLGDKNPITVSAIQHLDRLRSLTMHSNLTAKEPTTDIDDTKTKPTNGESDSPVPERVTEKELPNKNKQKGKSNNEPFILRSRKLDTPPSPTTFQLRSTEPSNLRDPPSNSSSNNHPSSSDTISPPPPQSLQSLPIPTSLSTLLAPIPSSTGPHNFSVPSQIKNKTQTTQVLSPSPSPSPQSSQNSSPSPQQHPHQQTPPQFHHHPNVLPAKLTSLSPPRSTTTPPTKTTTIPNS